MDAKRVRQILSSPADIEVTYNGTSVWIDQLHHDETTATVHLRGAGSMKEPTTVEISQLTEE